MSDPDAPDPHAPQSLYPLRAGSAWAYDVDAGDDDPVLAVTRVQQREGPRVTVLSGSEQLLRYELRPRGIFRPAQGVWLLRAPLTLGAEWPSTGGKVARVSDVDARVTVPAGEFSHCVEVHESGGRTGLDIRTVYCPFVGPVRVESSMRVRGRQLRVIARLRGYAAS